MSSRNAAPSLLSPQNRELSWLSFNARVLQEAADPSVPLLDRLRFGAIVSSNLDEFCRVRIGALVSRLNASPNKRNNGRVKAVRDLLDVVSERTSEMQSELEWTLAAILAELAERHHIHLIAPEKMNREQREFVRDYFQRVVRTGLTVVMQPKKQTLERVVKTDLVYFGVQLEAKHRRRPHYAVVRVGHGALERFVRLPDGPEGELVYAWLDDVIRMGMPQVFDPFGYHRYQAWCFKATRSAEVEVGDFDLQVSERFVRKLKDRDRGAVVRFIHDADMPDSLLKYLTSRLATARGVNIVAGGRYHSFRDFSGFHPPVDGAGLRAKEHRSLAPPKLKKASRYFPALEKSDVLLHFPYHSFRHVINLLREASLDPSVTSIKMTIYRAARDSEIIDALINAMHNGKSVTVLLEVKARFDEAANVVWQQRLEEVGVNVLHGMPNYKVHAKLCLIERSGKRPDISVFSTGNFNERSARYYSDCALLTSNAQLGSDVKATFRFLRDPAKGLSPKRLLVSPHHMREPLAALIEREIKHARAGRKAHIWLKLNNLNDPDMLKCLDEAARSGVGLSIVARGVLGMDTDDPNYEGRVRAVSIIDSYLEHTRVFAFRNNGAVRVYISSADLMMRNLDHRVEVATPILSSALCDQLIHMIELQLADNVKARVLNGLQDNPMQRIQGKKVRAQQAWREYLRRDGAD